MSTTMVKCKVCGNDIAENAKVCPQCGAKNKKPIYKKWWFWGIIVFIIIILLSLGESEDTNKNSENSNLETQETENKTNDMISVVENYKWLAQNASASFSISEKSVAFMEEHEEFFPGNENIKGAISDYVNWEIDYPHLSKSIRKYSGELFSVSGYVIDIEESDDEKITYLHIKGYDGYDYTFYYLGVLEAVFEETEVAIYALPLDIVKFENMGGTYTEAIVSAACYVQTEVYN